MTTTAGLSYRRAGAGQPMLLIHGIGHRRQMWQPVLDLLADQFDMIAIDLPGFGESAALPRHQQPTPRCLADNLESLMDEVGWDTAHLVGNSLGGWLALELGRRRRGRSVTALMPAGLWRPGRGNESLRHRALFAWWQTLVRLPGSAAAARNPLARTVALAGAFGRPWKIPPDVVDGDVRNLRACDMSRTMSALTEAGFTGGQAIAVPVTVTLGGRDPLIRCRDIDLSRLPRQTRVITLPAVGHVPTWDDPEAVASTIRGTTQHTVASASASP